MSAAAVTQAQIAGYADDGVVLLRGAIDDDWIEVLRAGIERNLVTPSERARLWNRDASGCTTFYDSQAWRLIDEYREFILHSPLAELVAAIMGSTSVNFFFDAVFVRSQGAQFRTPFHQDEPYWSVEGFDCSSAWMPLVPVAKKSALEFVQGSHRWNQRYYQTNFGTLTGDQRDQVVFTNDDADRVPFPDIEGQRDRFDVVSWDMEPGDIALFNARMIHGGSGNLDADRELRVFDTKWLGDDVRISFKPEGMDPDHSQMMTEAGLRPGDRVRGPLYPQVWPAVADSSR